MTDEEIRNACLELLDHLKRRYPDEDLDCEDVDLTSKYQNSTFKAKYMCRVL